MVCAVNVAWLSAQNIPILNTFLCSAMNDNLVVQTVFGSNLMSSNYSPYLMGWMQGISCVLFLPFQDSLLSPFLVYQFHSPFDLTFVAAMIKNDDNRNYKQQHTRTQ